MKIEVCERVKKQTLKKKLETHYAKHHPEKTIPVSKPNKPLNKFIGWIEYEYYIQSRTITPFIEIDSGNLVFCTAIKDIESRRKKRYIFKPHWIPNLEGTLATATNAEYIPKKKNLIIYNEQYYNYFLTLSKNWEEVTGYPNYHHKFGLEKLTKCWDDADD